MLDDRRLRLAQLGEDAELLLQDFGALADGVDPADGAVSPHFKHQLVEVGHVADARLLYVVVNLLNRRKNGVYGDHADGQPVRLVRGEIAAPVLDGELHRELRFGGVQRRQEEVRIGDLVVGGNLDVAGSDLAFSARFQVHFGRSVGEGAQA